jgi:hypothetical protein
MYSYNTVVNRPVPCTYCPSTVHGRIVKTKIAPDKEETICKWICGRCGNLVKVGKIE